MRRGARRPYAVAVPQQPGQREARQIGAVLRAEAEPQIEADGGDVGLRAVAHEVGDELRRQRRGVAEVLRSLGRVVGAQDVVALLAEFGQRQRDGQGLFRRRPGGQEGAGRQAGVFRQQGPFPRAQQQFQMRHLENAVIEGVLIEAQPPNAPEMGIQQGDHARQRRKLLPVRKLEMLRLEEKAVFPEERAIVHVRLL